MSSSNQQYTMSSILESWQVILPFWHLFSTFAKTYGNAICIAYRTARMATRVACSAIPVSTAVCHPSGIVSFSPLAFSFTQQIMAPRQGKQGLVHNHRHLYDQLDYGPVASGSFSSCLPFLDRSIWFHPYLKPWTVVWLGDCGMLVVGTIGNRAYPFRYGKPGYNIRWSSR